MPPATPLLILLPLSACRFGAPGADDSAAPVDTVSTASPWDSPQDSPVDTVSGATSDSEDTGDGPLPVGEIVLLEDARALFLGRASALELGAVVAGLGDIDGDGLADIGLGAPGADWDDAGSGATLIFSGATASGSLDALAEHDLRLVALGHDEGSGAALCAAGDVDGDGWDDLAMAARSSWDNGDDPGQGWLHLWWGPLTVDARTADADVRFGLGSQGSPVLAGGGDVDGDGLHDLVVGMAEHAQHSGGVAWVLTGAGLDSWGTLLGTEGAAAGAAVSLAGDVDGDGYDDVVVGAPGVDGAPGMAAVVRGAATPLGERVTSAAWLRIEGSEGQHAGTGYDLAWVGDVEGDGRSELSVCASQRPDGAWRAEQAALLRGVQLAGGGTVGIDEAFATFLTEQAGAASRALATAGPGDLDGDGMGDWLVAAPGHEADSGVAYLFLAAGMSTGGALGPADANYHLVGADQGGFGLGLAVAGDVDASGRDAVLLGGPAFDAGGGAVALFLPPR